jgi:hypothetical protein
MSKDYDNVYLKIDDNVFVIYSDHYYQRGEHVTTRFTFERGDGPMGDEFYILLDLEIIREEDE